MREPGGTVRPAYADFAGLLDGLSIESLVTKQAAAEELFRRLGITFAVYGEGGSTERLIPFDLIPRILDRAEWELVQRGCIQRVKAINIFLYDIYHDQEIVKAGLVPPEFVLLNPAYRPEMHGVEPPNKVYAHIAGIHLVRTGERDFFVLEDNVRTPSGVSYVLENREIMMRLFPDAFAGQSIMPVGFELRRLRHADRTGLDCRGARGLQAQGDAEPGQLQRPADARAIHGPPLIDGEIVPRHLDLRPFVLSGKETRVSPGGLTRVALVKDWLVVN